MKIFLYFRVLRNVSRVIYDAEKCIYGIRDSYGNGGNISFSKMEKESFQSTSFLLFHAIWLAQAH